MQQVIVICVVVAACLSGVSAANPRTPPPYRPIQDSIQFYFDPDSNYFVSVTSASCIIVPLTRTEVDHVHTSRGTEELELLMMREWIGKFSETRIYHNDPNLPHAIAGWCHARDMYVLNRPMDPQTTHQSPIVTPSP